MQISEEYVESSGMIFVIVIRPYEWLALHIIYISLLDELTSGQRYLGHSFLHALILAARGSASRENQAGPL